MPKPTIFISANNIESGKLKQALGSYLKQGGTWAALKIPEQEFLSVIQNWLETDEDGFLRDSLQKYYFAPQERSTLTRLQKKLLAVGIPKN